ncbi:MAG: phosphatidylglycerophosphatase A [Planctomycetota bacterium JB042]
MTAGGTVGDRLILLLATGFGSGRSRFAPGTAGTVVAAALVVALGRWTALPAQWTIGALARGSTHACLAIGARAEALLGAKDPGAFVLDEFAGFFVATLTLSSAWPSVTEVFVAFLLFRLFDVAKPTPARQLQNLGGGAGIVLDDLAAGVYALMGVTVFRQVTETPL